MLVNCRDSSVFGQAPFRCCCRWSIAFFFVVVVSRCRFKAAGGCMLQLHASAPLGCTRLHSAALGCTRLHLAALGCNRLHTPGRGRVKPSQYHRCVYVGCCIHGIVLTTRGCFVDCPTLACGVNTTRLLRPLPDLDVCGVCATKSKINGRVNQKSFV